MKNFGLVGLSRYSAIMKAICWLVVDTGSGSTIRSSRSHRGIGHVRGYANMRPPPLRRVIQVLGGSGASSYKASTTRKELLEYFGLSCNIASRAYGSRPVVLRWLCGTRWNTTPIYCCRPKATRAWTVW